MDPKKVMYAKRGQELMQNLKKRHFEAYYCDDRTAALEKALELIPEGASVGVEAASLNGKIILCIQNKAPNPGLAETLRKTFENEGVAVLEAEDLD